MVEEVGNLVESECIFCLEEVDQKPQVVLVVASQDVARVQVRFKLMALQAREKREE
jgi:hypothetical protein